MRLKIIPDGILDCKWRLVRVCWVLPGTHHPPATTICLIPQAPFTIMSWKVMLMLMPHARVIALPDVRPCVA